MEEEYEEVYLLTDGCMWELNKQTGNEHPHATEVVNPKTGAIRYIQSGSIIKFVEGKISDTRTQEAYNKATQKKDVSTDGQGVQKRTRSKKQRQNKESKSL